MVLSGRRRWLLVLAGLSVLLVATLGVVAHGDEDQSCLVCKARHQPLQEAPEILVLQAPPSTPSLAPKDAVRFPGSFLADSRPSRAPPA